MGYRPRIAHAVRVSDVGSIAHDRSHLLYTSDVVRVIDVRWPLRHTMRSLGPKAIASRTVLARTAIRSAGAPGAISARRRITVAASELTDFHACTGRSWAAITISPAVSNGQARPTG